MTARAQVLWIDLVDPDNHIAALAHMLQCMQDTSTLHIVVTGHPTQLALTKVNARSKFKRPEEGGGQDEVEIPFDPKTHVKEQAYEPALYDPSHARALLLAAVLPLKKALESLRCVCGTHFVLYDGGVAPQAGLSHAVVEHEDLFTDPQGNAVPFEAYCASVAALYDMAPAERCKRRLAGCAEKAALLGDKTIRPLLELAAHLSAAEEVSFAVGGPFTALRHFVSHHPEVAAKVRLVVSMACSWHGEKNLLGDCFNNQVDQPSFEAVVKSGLVPFASFVFVPTETCKSGDWLMVSAEELEAAGMPPQACGLVRLWTALKRGNLQPMFDVAAVMPRSAVPFALHPVTLDTVALKGCPDKQRCALKPSPPVDVGSYDDLQPRRCYAYGPDPSGPAGKVALEFISGALQAIKQAKKKCVARAC